MTDKHTDPLDITSDLEQAERDHAIQSARNYKSPVATGLCLNCSAEVAYGMRWCNSDCRNDWERYSEEPSRVNW